LNCTKYYYNADNLRVEKHHAGGAKEQFYYDGATVLVETDGSQTKVREYVNGGQYIDEVILVVNGSTYNYYMSDLRYCVTGFIDSTGAVVERARYDGYGKRTLLDATYATITTANVDRSYGYTGIRHDNESGLQYYRARYFDNTLGRFINHDPIGFVDGLNLYQGYFVIGGFDPSDLKWRDLGGDKWEATSDGDSLKELAKSITTKELDYGCIWPTGNTKLGGNDWKDSSTYPNASKCDTVDVSNLTTTQGKDLYITMDPFPSYTNNRAAQTLYSQSEVDQAILITSGQGKTPINNFEIFGHGAKGDPKIEPSANKRDWMISIGITSFGYDPSGLNPNLPAPSYRIAKMKAGPRRCWFTTKAKTYALACTGMSFANAFAKAFLRKGSWMKTSNDLTDLGFERKSSQWGFKKKTYDPRNSVSERVYYNLDDFLASTDFAKIDGQN